MPLFRQKNQCQLSRVISKPQNGHIFRTSPPLFELSFYFYFESMSVCPNVCICACLVCIEVRKESQIT